MTQLKTTQVKAFREELLRKQGGVSALTGLPIQEGKACLDHCHVTGRCRGVISRAENTALGKVENGFRYGREFDPIAFAKGLYEYLTKEQTLPLHPNHGKVRRRRRKT
jgi:hypothetical protein